MHYYATNNFLAEILRKLEKANQVLPAVLRKYTKHKEKQCVRINKQEYSQKIN
jgi:hypothetical protein